MNKGKILENISTYASNTVAILDEIKDSAGTSGDVNVTNESLDVAVSNFPATQTVSGSVSVSNFPATQPVSGSVSVSNFPATQPVSGSVSISGTPSVNATCSGTVAVTNSEITNLDTNVTAVIKTGSVANKMLTNLLSDNDGYYVGTDQSGGTTASLKTVDKNIANCAFADGSAVNMIRSSVRLFDGGTSYLPLKSQAGITDTGTARVCIASDDINLKKLSDCVDNVNHHLEVDTNAINGVTMAVNSGNNSAGVQRVCLATDDVNISVMKDYSLGQLKAMDYRLINAGRRVYCGGTTNAANGTYTIMSAANFPFTSSSPFRDSSQLYVETVNASDNGKTLKYSWFNEANPTVFTSLSSVTVSSAGNTNLAANIHEITQMYIEDAAGNSNDIYIKDANTNLVAEIRQGYKLYTPFMIQVPKNGCVLLSKLEVDNTEYVIAGRVLEYSIQAMRNTSGNSKSYAILFRGICPNQKSATFDLSGLSKINGSDYTAIFPVARGVSGTCVCGMFIHGVAFDYTTTPTYTTVNTGNLDHYIKPWA